MLPTWVRSLLSSVGSLLSPFFFSGGADGPVAATSTSPVDEDATATAGPLANSSPLPEIKETMRPPGSHLFDEFPLREPSDGSDPLGSGGSADMKDIFKLDQQEFDFLLEELEYMATEELVLMSTLQDFPPDQTGSLAVIFPITTHGVYVSDDYAPEALRRRLVELALPLETSALRRNRWHPGSDGQVLDLIHPSDFCAVSGRTKFSFNPNAMAGEHILTWPQNHLPQDTSKTTQWIPTDIFVDEAGSVSFESAINNVSRQTHRELYHVIAAVLQRAMPMFERSLESFVVQPRSRNVHADPHSIYEDFGAWQACHYLRQMYGKNPPAELIDKAQAYVPYSDGVLEIENEPSFGSMNLDLHQYPKGASLPAHFSKPENPLTMNNYIAARATSGPSLGHSKEQTKESEDPVPLGNRKKGRAGWDNPSTVESLLTPIAPTSERRKKGEKVDWTDSKRIELFNSRLEKETAARDDTKPPQVGRPLRECRLQVYVKLGTIHLTPEKPAYPGGRWHVEGLMVSFCFFFYLYFF
jgi:hypothetical protein